MKELLPIFSKHIPFGELLVMFLVLLKLTFSPLKQTEPSVEGPPAMLQNSFTDGQISVSLLVVFVGIAAWPCKKGGNGEFFMDTF